MKFEKPPLTYREQIKLLQSRGLSVPDAAQAEHYLKHISYYRLSAYALPFQKIKDRFNDGTAFADLLNLYLFDRELRMIVFDAIERIEIAIRAQMIYRLAHKYGPHWQDDQAIFVSPYVTRSGSTVDIFTETQEIIRRHCANKRPEVFIKHYTSKYTKPATPPSWMCIELLTIGELSRLYARLKNNADKKELADYFGLHHTLFESWFHTLTYVRNICAHHSRLWNREFGIQPNIPKAGLPLPWMNTNGISNSRCFFFLFVLKYFLHTINRDGHFKQRFVTLLQEHPTVPIQFLGIPSKNGILLKWENEPLWQ